MEMRRAYELDAKGMRRAYEVDVKGIRRTYERHSWHTKSVRRHAKC